jgi:hypothetical protein
VYTNVSKEPDASFLKVTVSAVRMQIPYIGKLHVTWPFRAAEEEEQMESSLGQQEWQTETARTDKMFWEELIVCFPFTTY